MLRMSVPYERERPKGDAEGEELSRTASWQVSIATPLYGRGKDSLVARDLQFLVSRG